MEKLAVVMSAYKETEEHFRLAVESILRQTYGFFEFIIVLDCPENALLDRIIREYMVKDNRIVYIKNEQNIGLAESLNKALRHTKCELVARMDADDVSFPDRLEKQIEYMERHPECKMVSTGRQEISDNGEVSCRKNKCPADYRTAVKALMYGNIITHPTVLYDRETVLQLGGYHYNPAAEDYDLWLRFVSEGIEFGFIDEKLLFYRMSANGISQGNPLRQRMCSAFARKKYRERKKQKDDSYTREDLECYLDSMGCSDNNACARYKASLNKLSVAKRMFQNRKIVPAMMNFLFALFGHKEIIMQLWDSFGLYMIVGKQREKIYER